MPAETSSVSGTWGSGLFSDTPSGPSRFLSTAWTVVVQARDGDSQEARENMGLLIDRYWRPVFHFIRRFGNGAEEAKDLTQGFFAQFLEKGAIGYADRERGRFRNFLLACVRQYLAREHHAAERRPVELRVDFDNAANEQPFPAGSEDPEQAFNRTWAKCLVENAIARLKTECEALDKPQQYHAFRLRMVENSGRADAARLLSMGVKDVDNLLAGARKRFRRLLRDEVCSSMTEEAAMLDEIRDLLASLQ